MVKGRLVAKDSQIPDNRESYLLVKDFALLSLAVDNLQVLGKSLGCLDRKSVV